VIDATSTSSTAPAPRADPGSAMVWTVPDDDPLPAITPRSPRLERVLVWLAPRWAARRAAARVALHQHAVARRLADVAEERRRTRDAPAGTWLRPRLRDVRGYRIPR
jgi:hypothetical protein